MKTCDVKAEQLANEVLKEIYIKNGSIVFPIDPFELIKEKNILFTFSEFEELKGIILKDEENVTIIGINKNRPWSRQRFTAAHEYCHFIKDLKNKIEQVELIV